MDEITTVDNANNEPTGHINIMAQPSPALKALRTTAKEVAALDDSLDGAAELIKAAKELTAEREMEAASSPSSKQGRESPFPALRDRSPSPRSGSDAQQHSKTVRIADPLTVSAAATPLSVSTAHDPVMDGSPHRAHVPTRSDSPTLKAPRGGALQSKGRSSEPNDVPPKPIIRKQQQRPESSSGPSIAATATVATDKANAASRDRAAYLKSRARAAAHRTTEGEDSSDGDDDRDEGDYRSRSSSGVASAAARSLKSRTSDVSVKLAASLEQPWLGPRLQSGFTSSMQEALFLSMRDVKKVGRGVTAGGKSSSSSRGRDSARGEGEGKPGLSTAELRRIADRLGRPTSAPLSAKDRMRDPTLQFLLYEEADECTFRPKGWRKKRQQGGRESSPEGKRNEDTEHSGRYYDRMDDQERRRQVDRKDAEGEAAYEAIIDKKHCPKCGAKQKYDEIKSKKNQCPGCKVDYCHKITWGQVQKKFFAKEKQYQVAKKEGMEQIVKAVREQEAAAARRTGKGGKHTEGKEAEHKWNEDVQREFFERQEASLRKKVPKELSSSSSPPHKTHPLIHSFRKPLSRRLTASSTAKWVSKRRENYGKTRSPRRIQWVHSWRGCKTT